MFDKLIGYSLLQEVTVSPCGVLFFCNLGSCRSLFVFITYFCMCVDGLEVSGVVIFSLSDLHPPFSSFAGYFLL